MGGGGGKRHYSRRYDYIDSLAALKESIKEAVCCLWHRSPSGHNMNILMSSRANFWAKT